MAQLIKAKEPFTFYSRLHLTELTGLSASTLNQLLTIIKKAPGSSIYHHTHRFLQQHQYLSPEPPNDFAYWVGEALAEDELAEKLASINIIQFSTIRLLRERIIQIIENYIKDNPSASLKFARGSEEFHFMKSVSFIFPTNYIAFNLKEFVDILRKITLESLYFHIFESRLRLEKQTNDFSNWIENSIGDKPLADGICRLDPYTYTLEDLRKKIINMIEKKA